MIARDKRDREHVWAPFAYTTNLRMACMPGSAPSRRKFHAHARRLERARPGDGVVGCGCVCGWLVGWSVLVCAFVCAFGLRSCVRFVVCSRVSCPGLRFIEAPSRPGPAGDHPRAPTQVGPF